MNALFLTTFLSAVSARKWVAHHTLLRHHTRARAGAVRSINIFNCIFVKMKRKNGETTLEHSPPSNPPLSPGSNGVFCQSQPTTRNLIEPRTRQPASRMSSAATCAAYGEACSTRKASSSCFGANKIRPMLCVLGNPIIKKKVAEAT